jgi:DNA-binding transcriptional MerR regulator
VPIRPAPSAPSASESGALGRTRTCGLPLRRPLPNVQPVRPGAVTYAAVLRRVHRAPAGPAGVPEFAQRGLALSGEASTGSALGSALGAGLTMGFVARPVLLRTGAFARAPTLSLKALRVYHEMGLLVPSVMDPETGYRAYSPAQLTDTAIIRLLREVGVSLQDITTVLDARDLGFVRKVLAEQAERFQAGLDAVGRLVDDPQGGGRSRGVWSSAGSRRASCSRSRAARGWRISGRSCSGARQCCGRQRRRAARWSRIATAASRSTLPFLVVVVVAPAPAVAVALPAVVV